MQGAENDRYVASHRPFNRGVAEEYDKFANTLPRRHMDIRAHPFDAGRALGNFLGSGSLISGRWLVRGRRFDRILGTGGTDGHR